MRKGRSDLLVALRRGRKRSVVVEVSAIPVGAHGQPIGGIICRIIGPWGWALESRGIFRRGKKKRST
jgi:hypothetical protein